MLKSVKVTIDDIKSKRLTRNNGIERKGLSTLNCIL